MIQVTAALVFDSWLDSVPERRGRKLEDRHLIYEGGGVLLDLLLKQSGQEGLIQVGGQILSGDSATGSVAGIHVEINPGGQSFMTVTNALGEFGFQSVPQLPLDLSITLPNQRLCVRCPALDEPHRWQVVPMVAAGGGL